MKLKVGKSYKDRSGNVVEIVDCYNQILPTSYPFVSRTQRYTESGIWDKHAKTDMDLIEELSMLHLEVGKKYKDRIGNIVEIIMVDSFYGDFRYIGKGTSGECERYRPDGECILHGCKTDLIEEMDEAIKDKSFKSVQEIYAYLGAGGIVKVKNNAIIYYFENDELTREYTKVGRKETQREKDTRSETMYINFDIYGSFEKYERPPIKNWDDDIPKQGILCIVTDKLEITNHFTLIFQKIENLYYDEYGSYWSNARPATIEDLTQYLYESK